MDDGRRHVEFVVCLLGDSEDVRVYNLKELKYVKGRRSVLYEECC